MRVLFKTSVLLILFLGVFFAGAVTSGLLHWFQPLIEVSVINNSGQHISDIQVSLETGRQNSISSFGRLERGQARVYRFYVEGEGGYTLTAMLEDGRRVRSDHGYVESGYSIKETVTGTSIKAETTFYGF